MKRMGLRIALVAVLAASLPAAAADWDAAAVAQDLSDGQPSQALEATHTRLADHPDDPQARFLQAMALADSGDAAGAISGYEELSRQYPRRPRVWNNLGVLYARQGRLDAARDALAHAVHAEPGYAAAHENLGDVYVALAHQAYRRARRQGADAAAMNRRRSGLERLLPSLPSAAEPAATAPAESDRPGQSATSVADHGADGSIAVDARQAIEQALSRWAKARTEQELSAYLSVYSDDYQPHGETTRAQWIRQQRVRLDQPESAAVSVSDVRVTAEGADRARVVFRQHDQRRGDDRDAIRHMLFSLEDGSWRIRRDSRARNAAPVGDGGDNEPRGAGSSSVSATPSLRVSLQAAR